MVNINQTAPDFKAKALINGEEKEISLKDFKSKKIVIYFYPKDLTPGCTTQACNLRDNFEEFKKKDIIVIGISKDSIKSHLNFANKKNLPFILISDEDKTIQNLYGVWQEKSFMGKKFMGTLRNTFLIDENFKIIKIITKPDVSNHSKEIFEEFDKQK